MTSDARTPNRIRQLGGQRKYDNLSSEEAGPLITRQLEQISEKINNMVLVKELPFPKNFSATAFSGGVQLRWDDIPNEYKAFLAGARIWRAAQSADAHTEFTANSNKRQIAGLVKATFYADLTVDARINYIYWVENINLDGAASLPAGGKIASTAIGGVPNAPTIAVIGERMENGAAKFTVGIERPTQNYESISKTTVQIATGSDSSFAYPEERIFGAAYANFEYITTAQTLIYFRAKSTNIFGDSPWSTVVTKNGYDTFPSEDTSWPSEVRNLTVMSDQDDTNIEGKELVVIWDRPLQNFNTIWTYQIQLHTTTPFPTETVQLSGDADFTVGLKTFTDPDVDFGANNSLAGMVLFTYFADPASFNNANYSALILSNTQHTITTNGGFRHGGNRPYKVIVKPHWELVTKAIDLFSQFPAMAPLNLQSTTTFRVVVRGLANGSYYARVCAVNVFGFSNWVLAGSPTQLTGIKSGDIKDGAVTGGKINDGAVSLTKFSTGLRPIETVDSLPAAGTVGRHVFLTTDKKLYKDTGTAWEATANAADLTGQIVQAQIADAAINTAKFAQGIKPVELVGSLPTAGNQGRVVFLTTDSKLYRDTGTVWVASVPAADITGTLGTSQIADLAITANKLAQGINPVDIVQTLPAFGNQGRIVFLKTDNKLYRDTGSAWVASVPTTDLVGQIVTAQIANGAVTATQLAQGINPVDIVSSLPAFGNHGRIVFLTTDNQLYRDTGTAWTLAVPATNITGQIVTAQIANGAVTVAQLAAGINPVDIVGTLPAFGNQGRIVFLTTDNQLYRDTGTAWTVAVPAVNISGQIGATQITDGAVTTDKLNANAVTAAKIAAGTITATELAANAVTAAKIAAGTITATELAAGAITAGKIAAGTIVSNDIAANTITGGNIAAATITGGNIAAATISASHLVANTITAGQIQAGAIGTNQLAAGAITAAKIAAGTISATEIAAGAIGTLQLSAGAVTAAKIAAGTITANEIASNTITAGKIAAGAIGATELAAGAVTAGKIAAGVITATEIAGATITGAKIASYTITGNNIVAGTITANEIASNTITAGQISAGAIGTTELAALAVTAAKIAAGAITAVKIAAETITGAKIAGATITGAKIEAGTITGSLIYAGTITAANIAAGAITAVKIEAGAITADKIAAGTITANLLSATAIDGKTITGATFQTTSYDARLIITAQDGLRMIDSIGLVAVQIWLGGLVTRGIISADLNLLNYAQYFAFDLPGPVFSYVHGPNDFDIVRFRIQMSEGEGSAVKLQARHASGPGYPQPITDLHLDTALTGTQEGGPAFIRVMTGGVERANFSTKGLGLANVSSEPVAPASGGILYSYSGALKYISAGGTRTTVAPN